MILIVDDKKENIFSLKKLLELNNHEVDVALSGDEALKKVLKTNYALIILDVQMPVMDGFEVAEAISGYSKSRDTPVIFLSAVNTNKKFITRGYLSGGIDYITKPFDPDLLLLKVNTFIRLYNQTKELQEIQDVLREEIKTRQKAEVELMYSVTQLQTILETLPQIAFTLNTDGSIDYVNTHWYDYAPGKFSFPETSAKNKKLAQKVAEALENQKQVFAEVEIKNLSTRSFRHHLFSLTPVQSNDEVVKWVGLFTDIHEQKMANQLLEEKVEERTLDLLKTNAELEASNYDLQQYASVASHDLKEPLRKIQVFSNMLEQQFVDKEHPAFFYVKRIMQSSQRMTNLIDDLLSHSGLSVDSLYKLTDVNEVVSGILSDLEMTIQEKNADIVVGDFPEMEVIPGQLRQLLQNIISNSLKFSTKNGKPEIIIQSERVDELSFDAPVSAHGKFCRLTIRDNGIGFEKKYADKIFTLFQRLNPRSEYEGTGIGLAIVKKIVEKHNGIVTADSEEGNGATFTVVLPIHQMESAYPQTTPNSNS